MKLFKNSFSLLLLSSICLSIHAQSVNPATGGNGTGTGGSVTYTVGQIVYTTNTGTNGTVSQGVQQPFEISVVTAIQNTDGIILECIVYPNPTRGQIKLVIKTKDFENLRFQLYDLNGVRIQDKKMNEEETEILMGSLFPSTYILKVLTGNKELKTFKIIKY